MKPVTSLLMMITIFFCGSVNGADSPGDFVAWRENFRKEALAAGISSKTLNTALADIPEPLAEVIERDRRQPEFTQSLADYVAARVNEKRIDTGRKMMKRYPTWLGRVEKKHGVQRRFLVALWGTESNFGQYTGDFPVIASLATLAYDGRRGAYFRGELLNALHILDAGHIPFQQMKGSWAGAMGQCQFMPSSFRRFAVDADGDGRIDIWNSVPDVLASSANYLARAGWKKGQTWGRPVKLPAGFDISLAGLENSLPLSQWRFLGVKKSDGRFLPRSRMAASLILPDGPEGPAFLVYHNFRVLLAWNRSNAFAVAVGTLADRIGSQ
ncbi:MAG: lytic murein transglycosylase [Desulfuromonadaceae bacterium]|nr:lytic murein transglycosylase [Desulfuromonadaceae bacterium]